MGGTQLTESTRTARYDGHVSARLWLSTVLGVLLMLTLPPATATADDSGLTVRIDQVSPTMLSHKSSIVVRGEVTNETDEQWGSVHAYLVRPRWPFTTRQQIDNAIENGDSYTGERIIDPGTFDEMGDLEAGESRRFEVRVPASSLKTTRTQGIYPIGIQILATAPDGERSTTALAKATTFVPRINAPSSPIPAGTVWPFLPTWSVTNPDPARIAESVTTGQLRRYLTIAKQTPRAARTLVIDPALLDDLDEIAAASSSSGISNAQAKGVRQWLDELLTLSRTSDTWIMDYGRPDVAALITSADTEVDLPAVIAEATTDALQRHELSGPRIVWPTAGDTTASLLKALRAQDGAPVIVSSERLRSWEPRHGSVVVTATKRGPLPLLVRPDTADIPGTDTPATIAQSILTNAGVAVLARDVDPKSRADALIFIDPRWDPGTSDGEALVRVLGNKKSSLVQPSTLTGVLQSSPATLPGSVSSATPSNPLPDAQLKDVSRHQQTVDLITDLTTNGSTAPTGLRDSASALSLRWRTDPEAAQTWIQNKTRLGRQWLSDLKIETPRAITLSGQTGSFPLTLRNDTDSQVTIALDLETDNPALTFEHPDTIIIGSGERHTLTVAVAMGNEVSSTVTARLSTPDGRTFGTSAAFLVRSSNVGVMVWVGIAVALTFFVLTWTRRFLRHRGRRNNESESQHG